MPRKRRRRKPTHRAILFRVHPIEGGLEIVATQVNYHTKEELGKQSACAQISGWENLHHVLPDMMRGLLKVGPRGLTSPEELLH
jgi:hypothetical protein